MNFRAMTYLFVAGGLAAAQDRALVEEKLKQALQQIQINVGNSSFVTAQLSTGPTVKGAPYSAEAVNETVQVLPDGNRISRKSTTMLYRDSDGRERREETIGSKKAISITDPVAGASYSLDPESKVARRVGTFSTNGNGREIRIVAPPNGVNVGVARTGTFVASTTFAGSTSSGFTYSTSTQESGEMKKESLGERNIEGVIATGTRTTRTIPAGQIGNERPIDVVSESWYSNELQAVVMTKQSDPRSGETTYRLTNISRSSPARYLFEVPSDYTTNDGAIPVPPPPPAPRK